MAAAGRPLALAPPPAPRGKNRPRAHLRRAPLEHLISPCTISV
eukprot:CAMPEP_0198521634 /NCGR_PEP_ID=MMETSP1462-20131121/21051_1 /TAXON_ID=1333877 /ORGANISM="Brandtodinium nutriculum, Strain RCC3387" /LENGTH=42 /DNA_ID= /DNA_START= /DNA_END= /DNA_ORIENTATION=